MLYLNNIPIPVENSYSVRINYINPACFHSEIKSNAALGIRIALNPVSRAVFGNPERFEKHSSGADRTYPNFEVRPQGMLLISGNLIITNANSEFYFGWVQSELGAMGDTNRNKMITELNWLANQSWVQKTAYNYPTDNFRCLNIKNQAFWEGKGREEETEVGYTDADDNYKTKTEVIEYLTRKFKENASYIVNTTAPNDLIKNDEGCVVSPFLYMKYVIKELLRLTGWVIDTNDFDDDTTVDRLCLYHNFNILKPQITTETQTKTRYDYDDDNQHIVVEDVTAITVVTWLLSTFDYKDLIPAINIGDFLLGFQNMLNFVFFFTDKNKVDIIDRNAIPDSDTIDIDAYFVDEWEMGDRKNVSLKFIAEYEPEDGYHGDNWHDLSDRAADFGTPVYTHANLLAIASPAVGELRLVIFENKIYEYRWGVHTGEGSYRTEDHTDILMWEYVSTGPQPYKYGTGDETEEIKTCFSSLVTYDLTPTAGALHPGNVHHMRSLWKNFTPRMLAYTLANSGRGSNTNGTITLNWDGANGLFATRWEKWAKLWKNRLPVEGRFNFPLNMIYYVKNNIHHKFRTRQGEFIIEEMETEFTPGQVGITRIKGYKV